MNSSSQAILYHFSNNQFKGTHFQMDFHVPNLSLIGLLKFHIFIVILFLVLSISRNAYAANILSSETDKLALLDFQSKLTSDPSHVVSSWNDSVHFCHWRGVACDLSHQRVISLELSGLNLAGTLSPTIGNLSFLETLDLSENSFTSKVPSEIGSLTSLKNLNLSFNFLEGNIPSNLSSCLSLMNLDLGQNKLTDQIPPGLGSLSKLKKLYLYTNNLTGNLPASFGNLSSLQELRVSYNNLEGEIPHTLSLMQNLTVFRVGVNHFSGLFPIPLYNISSLHIISITRNNFHGDLREDLGLVFPNILVLYLGENSFTGHIPFSLANASNLFRLDMSGNKFTGSVPLTFGNLKALNGLDLNSNQLTSDDLDFLTPLTNCSRLEFLNIGNNEFHGEFPRLIGNLSSQLSTIIFDNNSIHGSIPAEFANLVGLNTLTFGLNSLTGNIPASLGKLPNLKELRLESNELSGEIPSSLGNLTQLLKLYLNDNRLQGTIPSGFGNFKIIGELNLSHNRLNGTIPKNVTGLPTLSNILDLSHNSLTGALPREVGKLQLLTSLDVSYNKLSGEIPNEIGQCLSLNHLSLQSNLFQGTIPSMNQLKGIHYLDLSSNELRGQIPQDLGKLNSLVYLNLSFNNLEGEVPLDGVFKNASAVEIKGNKNLCGGISQLSLQPCLVKSTGKSRNHQNAAVKVALAIVIPFSLLVLVLSLLTFMYLKKKNKKKNSRTEIPSAASIELIHFHPKITYEELHDATRGFSSENLIGTGSFGRVYRGAFSPTKVDIAVKVLNLHQTGASKSFLAECQALRNIRHRNLVKVLSVCSSSDYQGNHFKALIYQFMPNGSLDRWLHPQEGQSRYARLGIVRRINIAVDIASALHYLHSQCPTTVIHCDLKPSNVLLDNDLTAHVSDFGLARLLVKFDSSRVNQFSSLVIKGTIGYTAPEYGMGGAASTWGDVYSYGILLLELFTGKSPTDKMFQDGFNLHNFVKRFLPDRVLEIVDKSALVEAAYHRDLETDDQWIECLISLLGIGVTCSAEYPQDRMNMRHVVDRLHSIRDRLPRPQVKPEGKSYTTTPIDEQFLCG